MIDRPLTGALDSGTDAEDEQARDRAQTVQDFAVGIGIFLLAVAFVFSFVPSIITPFADAGGADTAQADRIAATIVENASEEWDKTNEINATIIGSGHYDGSSDDLAPALGLRKTTDDHAIDRVNITVIEIDAAAHSDPIVAQSGDPYDDQVGASATRIVTTPGSDCEPACQLIVRVW